MSLDHHSLGESTPSTILVVEPDILVRMVIADYLRNCGYKVFEGVTADDVVTVLGSQQKIDVIFAEVQLSGSMDGEASHSSQAAIAATTSANLVAAVR